MKKKWLGLLLAAIMLAGTAGEVKAEGFRRFGWVEIEDNQYWYENGIRQGTEGRGKEIFDPDSNAWYWLDSVDNGKKAVSKDLYQESAAGEWAEDKETGTGKWVRYDEEGHMIKGWYTNENGTYYFDRTYGTMAKGTCVIGGKELKFDEMTGILLPGQEIPLEGWVKIDGVEYWYEDGVRQGYNPDDPSYRGKEIYDPDSNKWYWLDNVQQGAKAVNKDVYQESYAGKYADREDGTGKWVRYDKDGHMIKGWNIIGSDNPTKAGIYYFDEETGAMLKGKHIISGMEYVFDQVTGKLISEDSASDEDLMEWVEEDMDHSFDGMIFEDAYAYYGPVFDDVFYFFGNQELGESIDPYDDAYYTTALRHFLNQGMLEGKQGDLQFKLEDYRKNYPELEAEYGDHLKSYYIHYIETGVAENRTGAGNVQEKCRISEIFATNQYFATLVFQENKLLNRTDGVYITDGISKYPVTISLHPKDPHTMGESNDYQRYNVISEPGQIPAGFQGELVLEAGTLQGEDGSVVGEIRHPVSIENYAQSIKVEVLNEEMGEPEVTRYSDLLKLENGTLRLFSLFDNQLYVTEIDADGNMEQKKLLELDELFYGVKACQTKSGDSVLRVGDNCFYRYKADGNLEFIGKRADVMLKSPYKVSLYAVGDTVVMDYRDELTEKGYFLKILPDNTIIRAKGYDQETGISYDFTNACYLEDGNIVDIADDLEDYHLVFDENLNIMERIPNEYNEEKNENRPPWFRYGYVGTTYSISRTENGYQFWDRVFTYPQIRTRECDRYGITTAIEQIDEFGSLDLEVIQSQVRHYEYDVDVMDSGKAVLLTFRQCDRLAQKAGDLTYYGLIHFYDNQGRYLTSYEDGYIYDIEQIGSGDVAILTEGCVKILKSVY